MVDYAFDPAKTNEDYILSNANRTVTCDVAGTLASAISDWNKTSGKWYWEVTIDNLSATYAVSIGLCDQSGTTDFTKDIRTGWNESWALLVYSGSSLRKYHDGSNLGSISGTWVDGDIIMVAMDIDEGKAWFGKNGTWYESGDPAGGTNPQFNDATIIGKAKSACVTLRAVADQMTVNFGTSPFSYDIPSGFSNLVGGLIAPSMFLVF